MENMIYGLIKLIKTFKTCGHQFAIYTDIILVYNWSWHSYMQIRPQ